jgi:ABC-type polysaccharide/polyol phosphate transport system ATPase subunit
MSEVVIKANNISKKYRLGKPQGDTFKEAVSLAFRSLFGRTRKAQNDKDLWALKDVSFELAKGEALGIVGRNGAGKSTLLKILAEITHPTSGSIEINGKIAAVLEIGMGFHPELSGVENVYLSGSVLGMSTSDISKVYNEIVAFSALEKFMDTPVKNYSSGMYMRLAFAVMAHVDADIFLFDEVLSVGDATFRFKCQKKINELVEAGKSIILVSHNLNDVANICPKSLLIDGGRVKAYGHTFGILNDYMEESITDAVSDKNYTAYPDDKAFYNDKSKDPNPWERITSETDDMRKLPPPLMQWTLGEDPGNELFSLTRLFVKAASKNIGDPIHIENDIEISIEFEKKTNDCFIDMGFGLSDKSGVLVFISNTKDIQHADSFKNQGTYTAQAIIPGNWLNSSVYSLSIFVAKNKTENIMNLPFILSFRVDFSEEELRSEWRKYYPPDPGLLRPKLKWEVLKG